MAHVIALNEANLHQVPAPHFEYYHASRPRLSLDRNAPIEGEVEPPPEGRLAAIPLVDGFHQRYTRVA